MKIEELPNCPAWLSQAKTENADVAWGLNCTVRWNSGQFLGGYFRGGEFLGGYFRGQFRGGEFLGGYFRGQFLGGEFRGGEFRGGQFLDGQFLGGQFRGGEFRGEKTIQLRGLFGLYKYPIYIARLANGELWIAMGCLFHSLDQWAEIGIRASNVEEFPDDGSLRSLERIRAFDFAKQIAIDMKASDK